MRTIWHRALSLSITASLMLALGGCITNLDVQKIKASEPEPEGFRYSLPVRLLQVCPGAQGTISVKEIFLPDPNNQYAISASSIVSKFDLDVTIDEGLLTKFTWKPDSQGVAEKLVETSGNLAKTRIETEAKAEQAKADQLAAAEKARKDALAAADKTIRDAELELRTAEAALAVLQGRQGFEQQRLEAEIAVAQAQAKLATAKEAKNQLLAATDGRIPGANAPSGSTAFGCLFYRVVEDQAKGVRLVAIEKQREFATSFKVTPRKEEKKEELAIQIKDSPVVRPSRKDNSLSFVVVSTLPVKIHGKKLTRLSEPPVDVTSTFKPILTPGGSQYRVDLADNTPAGTYTLSVELEAVGIGTANKSVEFEVRR